MAFDLETLKKKTRSEWRATVREQVMQVRIWIQENAEKGFLTALLLGLVIALAFRFVLTVSIIFAIVAGAVWYFAPEDSKSA